MRAGTLVLALAISVGWAACGGVDWYAVDPMAETPYMPDSAPKNGVKGGTVRIVAATGEYEPGSFVLVSDADLGKVQLELGEFKRDQGLGIGDQKCRSR